MFSAKLLLTRATLFVGAFFFAVVAAGVVQGITV